MNKTQPTREEIQEQLHFLKLATLVEERKKREEWFREHKIPLYQIETCYYLELPEVEREQQKETLYHFHQANVLVKMLQIELDWFKQHEYLLKLEKKGAVREYIFLGMKAIESEKS